MNTNLSKNYDAEETNVANTKETFGKWVKEHKYQIMATGAGIVTVGLIVLGLTKRGYISEMHQVVSILPEVPQELALPASDCIGEEIQILLQDKITRAPHAVSACIRRLPGGQHASAEKIATALANGFVLSSNETWVISYHTGNKVA